MSAVVRQIGPHILHLEPDATLFVKVSGEVETEHVRKLISECDAFAGAHASFSILVDLKGMGHYHPGARSMSVRPTGFSRIAAIGFFGATFSQRVMSMLVMKAARLVHSDFKAPVAYFETESEARAWLKSLLPASPRA